MHSRVKFALEHEIDARTFERLALALTGREGFSGIVPGSGYRDKGRDAEIRYWEGKKGPSVRVAFQFSLERKWEKKLLRDSATIAANAIGISTLVFVTTSIVTVSKRDALAAQSKRDFGWNLLIYDGEWLRYQLEEVHHDLTTRYLGIELPDTPPYIESQIDIQGLNEDNSAAIFRKIPAESIRASLIAKTAAQPERWQAWKELSDVEFHLRNYEGALTAITRTAAIVPNNWNVILRRASILAEMGIQNQSRPLLLQAKEVLVEAVKALDRAVDHYNLANVLGPLGQWEAAESHYRVALERDPTNPRIWKNLGSALFHRGKHTEEMQCYEKALSLDPNLVEGYLSKATAYMLALDNPEKALECFEVAYKIDPNLGNRWRHTRFWHSEALARLQQLEQALVVVDKGLAQHPDDTYLLHQKAKLLIFLWPTSPEHEATALRFYCFRAESLPNDFHSLLQICQIYAKRGSAETAWPMIERTLNMPPYSFREMAERASYSITDVAEGFQEARAYASFREDMPVTDYLVAAHTAGLDPSTTLEDALTLALMPCFGRMLRRMRNGAVVQSDDELLAVFDNALASTAKVMSQFGGAWLARARPDTHEKTVDLLATGIVVITDAVAAEAARQFGYCLGILSLPKERTPDAGARDWTDLRQDVVEAFLDAVQREWHVFDERVNRSTKML